MLGYRDKDGDFTPSDAALFAQRIGLISVAYSGPLTRGDLFEMARDALTFSYKDGSATVIEHGGQRLRFPVHRQRSGVAGPGADRPADG